MWKKECDKNTAYDTNSRSRATAYLCDSDNWTEYVGDKAPDGTYAVGGPTKELLVLSWNEAVKNGGNDDPKTEAKWQDDDVVANGYLYNKPYELSSSINPYPIQSTILNSLYNNGSSYWLASPSSFGISHVCSVFEVGFVHLSDYDYASLGARPLVSIPMSKIQIKDGIVTIGNN